MTDKLKAKKGSQISGWLSFILFCFFASNLLIGKLSILNQWGLPRTPSIYEFILLLLASGFFVLFSALSDKSGSEK